MLIFMYGLESPARWKDVSCAPCLCVWPHAHHTVHHLGVVVAGRLGLVAEGLRINLKGGSPLRLSLPTLKQYKAQHMSPVQCL